MSPASLALILPEFPPSRHQTAIAGWAAMGYLGNATAPSITALVGAVSWRWMFVGFGVVCAVIYVVSPRFLPARTPEPRDTRVDHLGVPLGALGVAALALTIIEGPALGWAHPAVLAGALGTVVLIPAFVIRSLRHPEPLLDLRVFRARTVWSANLANIFLSASGVAIWLVYALFLSRQWGWSVVRSGLALTPIPAGAGLTAILGARLAERFGARRVITLGSLLPVAGTVWLVWRLDADARYLVDFMPGALMFSTGFGFTFAPLNGAALRGVPSGMLGQANAAFNTLRQLAGGLGIAVMVAILGNGERIPIRSFEVAFVVNAAFTLACALVIAVAYPRDVGPRDVNW